MGNSENGPVYRTLQEMNDYFMQNEIRALRNAGSQTIGEIALFFDAVGFDVTKWKNPKDIFDCIPEFIRKYENNTGTNGELNREHSIYLKSMMSNRLYTALHLYARRRAAMRLARQEVNDFCENVMSQYDSDLSIAFRPHPIILSGENQDDILQKIQNSIGAGSKEDDKYSAIILVYKKLKDEEGNEE